ncbi:MAG: zinc ribbon domain-containing protein [Clostridia bacterium]|nr:zinc ribbon domain-containing protein [Clostridia bacterium]
MAFCQNCGAELKDGARFCENCGAAVPSVQEPVYSQPAYSAPEPQPVYSEPTAVVNTEEQSSAAKSALILSIVGLVLSELGLPGIIVCAIAKGKVKNAVALGATGAKIKVARILATVGMVFSIIMTVVWFIYLVAIIGVASSGALDELFEELEYAF